MKRKVTWMLRSALCAMAALCTVPADAFYPFGFFNESGNLQIIRWPLTTLDRNNNGDVDGPDDGILLNFETGNGVDGFTDAEIAKVMSGFEEWELVSTAYIAFARGQDIIDRAVPAVDLLNQVIFQSDTDVENDGQLAGGSFSTTLVTNSYEDTFYEVGDVIFPVSGGKIIEVDIVYDPIARETENTQFPFFKGLSVLTGGIAIGLNWSPFDNIDATLSQQAQQAVESRVATLPDATGLFRDIGVTPSMINAFVFYPDGTESHQDLAPDDIAGVTYLYPRSQVDILFNLDQVARTQTQDGFPSAPIAGAHIVAWGDADNQAGTDRVPWVDTFTGLYYAGNNTSYRGHFSLKGMFKQITLGQGFTPTATYTPTYVVSCTELTPVVFGDERERYDSTHGGFQGATVELEFTGHGFDGPLITEVFHEDGNRVGNVSQNLIAGTPLYFDLGRRNIVSANSNKSIDTILAFGRPMFGKENRTCPINVAIAGMAGSYTQETASLLRAFRDDVLMQFAAGSAVVNSYYVNAPVMTAYLEEHPLLMAVVQSVLTISNWTIAYAEWLLALTIVSLAVVLLRRCRQRWARTVATLGIVALCAGSAHAMLLPMDMADYARVTDEIIQGTVTSAESRMTDGGKQIVTDVLIQVDDVVKGSSNKGSQICIQLPTGRVGAIGRRSPDLPEFKKDEKVLLFLQCQPKGNYTVYAGIAGKYLIQEIEGREGEYVTAESFPAAQRLYAEAEKMYPEAKEARLARGERISVARPVYVPLDALKKHLHEAATGSSTPAPETEAAPAKVASAE